LEGAKSPCGILNVVGRLASLVMTDDALRERVSTPSSSALMQRMKSTMVLAFEADGGRWIRRQEVIDGDQRCARMLDVDDDEDEAR